MQLKLYANIRTGQLVLSPTVNSPFALPVMDWQKLIPFQIQLVESDPTGGVSSPLAIVPTSACSIRAVSIGIPGTPYCAQTTWTPDAVNNWFTGILSLNTTNLHDAITAAPGKVLTVIFEISVQDGSNLIDVQVPVTCKLPVYQTGLPDPTDYSPPDTLATNMAIVLQNTNSIHWTLAGGHITGDVQVLGGGGISIGVNGLYVDANITGLFVHKSGDAMTGALSITTATTPALNVKVSDAGTNTIKTALELSHYSSAAPVAGFGAALDFRLKDNDGNFDDVTARIISLWKNAGAGVERADLAFYTLTTDNTPAEIMRLTGTDAYLLLGYTAPAIAGYKLQVNGSGYFNGGVYCGDPATLNQAVTLHYLNTRTVETEFDAGAAIPNVTNGAGQVTLETGSNKIMRDVLVYDPSTEQAAQFKFSFPGNTINPVTFKAKIYWEPEAGATAGDGVVFGVSAMSGIDGDDINQAFGTEISVTDTVQATGKEHITTATGTVTPGGTNGPSFDPETWIKLARKTGAGGDNCPVNVRVNKIKIQYSLSLLVSGYNPVAW